MTDVKRALRIDRASRRDGTCRVCGLTRTVFAVVLPNSVHAWCCESCAGDCEAMP
jgi:hypothetical protein